MTEKLRLWLRHGLSEAWGGQTMLTAGAETIICHDERCHLQFVFALCNQQYPANLIACHHCIIVDLAS